MNEAARRLVELALKVQHIKEIARDLLGDDNFPEPTWERLSDEHDCSEDRSNKSLAEPYALVLRELLDRECRDNAILRQNMEDLCAEMERVKAEASRVFVMGPGVSKGGHECPGCDDQK